MSGAAVALAGFTALLLLIAVRMPVGLAMLLTGSAGYVSLVGLSPFLSYMKATPYHLFANYTLSIIPLFILMGAFAERSGLSTDLFRAAGRVFGRRKGGLAMAVIGASTVFGAICGSSVATTATFSRAALPELRRYGYDPGLAGATVAVGGTLGILVPPSVILVVYAIATEQNIVKLFQAALIPGLLAAVLHCIVIGWVARRDPTMAPAVEIGDSGGSWRGVWPALLVAVLVVGGIYGGVFTPTEGAAVGAVAMLLIGIARRTLGAAGIRTSLLQTAETTAMIFLILLGAEVFNSFLALSRLPIDAAETIAGSGYPPLAVLGLLLALYIILGAVMDELAMMLLTLPVFFPVVSALDFGLPAEEVAIWFGILVLIVVGIGLVAPPIGLNVFVVSAMAKDVSIAAIYRRVLPFIAIDIVRLMLVVAFPAIALLLVRALN
ncbi:MAG: TRAP transporter large permease [Hyphomicrobiaceae bacterium]|nr:TRAP transporter large permease [Hyphomicrobiaceae bacterium]